MVRRNRQLEFIGQSIGEGKMHRERTLESAGCYLQGFSRVLIRMSVMKLHKAGEKPAEWTRGNSA